MSPVKSLTPQFNTEQALAELSIAQEFKKGVLTGLLHNLRKEALCWKYFCVSGVAIKAASFLI